MSDSDSKRFVAKAAPVHQLSVKAAFDSLEHKEQRYAHHMARASWHGARIVLRQTSPESITIFDWILSLHAKCNGEWDQLRNTFGLNQTEVDAFLVYAACFLSNLGNYYGSGDQKFIPDLSSEVLEKLSLDSETIMSTVSVPPYALGFPGNDSQSTYYPGIEALSKEEIASVSEVMEKHNVYPENTRITKDVDGSEKITYRVLQASSKRDTGRRRDFSEGDMEVVLEPGDHEEELQKISADNRLVIKSYETGNLEVYRDALRLWVRDLGPRVEHIMGFVEPYRDPFGTRAEYEGLVAIADPKETEMLKRLVEASDSFIKELPWCHGHTENNGKGPFEKSLFEPPDFSSIHVLAYCSSILFPGINLPNYNDIRQDYGFKNVTIANKMSAESSDKVPNPYVSKADLDRFTKAKFPAYYIWVVLHELLGHGTGKMLCQNADQSYNFDHDSPPIDPTNGKPVEKWYLPGQTWTGQFKDLATTVDECRCELVGAYLMDNKEILALFGYTDDTEITAGDLTYTTYMQVAADGLRGLSNFNADSQAWGQAHSRGHFAMLKCLLRDGQGCVKVDFDSSQNKLVVSVDETRLSHGKTALGKMLLRLHMYRCTADVEACRDYYEDLSKVDGEYLEWRKLVFALQPPKWVHVHSNTTLEGNGVTLKEYPATPEGIIQSWAERGV